MRLIGGIRGTWRRGAALAGAFAILVQAILFGWHHHAFPFPPPVASAVTVVPTSPVPAAPAAEDHDCQICFTLSHHHGAVPVDFFAPSEPEPAPLHLSGRAVLDAPLAPYFFFQSRAPPVA
jgi:hypothetical protein